MYSHDVVFVGSGLVGLRATMELVGHPGVAVVTKADPSHSARFRAAFETVLKSSGIEALATISFTPIGVVT